jgi:hypothetical protein
VALPRPRYITPAAWVARKSLREGFLGHSRMWKVIGVAILARRAFRKLMGSDPTTVAIERIKPGETVVLRGVRSRKLPSA